MEIDPTDLAIFQNGKLVAFGVLTKYEQLPDRLDMKFGVVKGKVETGNFIADFARPYSVLHEGMPIFLN